VVEIEPPKDGWVKVKNDKDEEGLVPLDSLSKIAEIPNKATATKWEATKEHKGPGIQGFISLELGDIVVQIDPPKNDWVKVKNDRDEEGLVPLHSLSKIAENLSKATESKWEAIKEHESFGPQGYISLKLGEMVIEIEPPKNGLVKVKNDRHEEGLVPVDALRKKIQWKAKTDYDPEGRDGLIQLKKGELLDEVNPMKEDWVQLRNKDGAEGWAHVTFLEKQ